MPEYLNDGMPFLGRDADQVGLSRAKFRRAISDFRITRLFDGVFVDSRVPDSRELRVAAIQLVAPAHAVVCDSSASWIHGVSTFRPSERHTFVPSLVVPHGLTRTELPDVNCRQALIETDDVMEIGGVLVTTPIRTTADLLRKLWRPYALAAADGMAHAGLIDREDLWDFLARLKGYRGIRQARSLAYVIESQAASPGESWTRLRLLDAGFPRPLPQFEILDGRGVLRAFDLAYPDKLLAVEYDGREFHSLGVDREHDHARRSYFEDVHDWRFSIARHGDIFGDDPAFEMEVGEYIGTEPLLPRQW